MVAMDMMPNIEGFTEYDIPTDWHANREPGLSAMIRLKDEIEWIRPCLDSIVGWFDEIVICLQNCTDGTDEVVREYAAAYDHIAVYDYPFDSHPNGPGHDAHPVDSVYDRAYFYNWSLAKTTRTHVAKWDGDMVAMDRLGDTVRELISRFDIVRCFGVDICGAELQMSQHQHTANEPRFFRVTPDTYYRQGPYCEVFTGHHFNGYNIAWPTYLHFKWAKDIESASKAWPDNWRDIEHFQRIYANKAKPLELYTGEMPSCLLAYQDDAGPE